MTDASCLRVDSMSRRNVLINAVKVSLATGSLAPISYAIVSNASAQESSPEPDVFPPDELPILELEIEANGTIHSNAEAQTGKIAEGVSHMSGRAQAGTTVIRCTSQLEGPATVFFLYRPTESMKGVTFRQTVLAPGPRWWMYDQPLTGTFEFDPERTPSTQEMVVDVAPGLWRIIVMGTLQTFTTMEFVSDAAIMEVPADVSVQATEAGFEVPSEIPAGRHVWQFSNHDGTLHEFAIFSMPETNSVVNNAFLRSESERTSAAESQSTTEHAVGIPFISNGQTVYREIDLAPGTYLGLCTLPDAGSSAPHYLEGTIAPFTVV